MRVQASMPPHQLLFEQTRFESPQMCFSTGSRRGPTPHLTAGHARAVQLQRRAAGHPAANVLLCGCGSKISKGLAVESYALTTRPRSASEQRPVRQRHKSVASWRARATTVFFFKALAVVRRAMNLVRACQRG